MRLIEAVQADRIKKTLPENTVLRFGDTNPFSEFWWDEVIKPYLRPLGCPPLDDVWGLRKRGRVLRVRAEEAGIAIEEFAIAPCFFSHPTLWDKSKPWEAMFNLFYILDMRFAGEISDQLEVVAGLFRACDADWDLSMNIHFCDLTGAITGSTSAVDIYYSKMKFDIRGMVAEQ